MQFVRVLSTQYEELDAVAKRRYIEKLDLIDGRAKDPYSVTGERGERLADFLPLVEYPDIFNYLITAPSPVTKDDLKAYKSLDGYKFLVAGWVGDVTGYEATPDRRKSVIMAKVRHSQSVSATPLLPWIAAENSGTIICAHCTCKAGLGEACSHISALLFALEAHTKLVQDSACTSRSCQWLPPSLQPVNYCKIVDMDFSAPKEKRVCTSHHAVTDTSAGAVSVSSQSSHVSTASKVSSRSCTRLAAARPPSSAELSAFCTTLSEVSKPAVLSIVPGYADAYLPNTPADVPPPLTTLYDERMLEASFVDLLDHCEHVFRSISITKSEALAIDVNTREQAQSDLWFQCRAGRVTASKFKSAARTDKHQPSVSLVKAICYPQSVRFTSKATTWGCEHELSALKEYKALSKAKHTALCFSDSGLVVRTDYPFLGASPDGVVSCTCCGSGVIEAKCPFSCRDKSIVGSTDDSKFCLGRHDDGPLFLKADHAYYYQVQAQMFICKASYCDFVVYTNNDLAIVRVLPDHDFIASTIANVSAFFKLAVLPELVGKFFSKTFSAPVGNDCSSEVVDNQEVAAQHCCLCKQTRPSETVTCGNDNCLIKDFHLGCLKMKAKPKRKWYCPDCRKERKQKKDAKKANK